VTPKWTGAAVKHVRNQRNYLYLPRVLSYRKVDWHASDQMTSYALHMQIRISWGLAPVADKQQNNTFMFLMKCVAHSKGYQADAKGQIFLFHTALQVAFVSMLPTPQDFARMQVGRRERDEDESINRYELRRSTGRFNVFRHVTPCILMDCYKCFRGTCCLRLLGKGENLRKQCKFKDIGHSTQRV
jgi:hypothetical protein